MKGYIYLIENKINQKKYVGKTYFSIEERWRQHIRESKRDRSKNRPLYRALNKYGIENFVISELEYIENLEEREKYWINNYDSFHQGYNATLGGDGTVYFDHTDEEVIEQYNKLLTVKAVAQYFNCDTDTISNRLKNNGIKIESGGNIYNPNRLWVAKKIEQYDLKNNYLRSFDSLSRAGEWLISNGYATGSARHAGCNISRCARGIRNSAYGFKWKENMQD